MQIVVHFLKTHVLNFDAQNELLGSDCKNSISEESNIPRDCFKISQNGVYIGDDDCICYQSDIIIRATLAGGLAGGKGGFGAMLRAQSKQKGKKQTTDFGACRDLNGRRLRHVNDEKILEKWQEAQEKGEEFDVDASTDSGLKMWYLGTPGWTDGFKESYRTKFMKPRLKTTLCIDWVKARENRPNKEAPPGTPSCWGCPRGQRCEFAHGESELRGGKAKDMEDSRKRERDTEEHVKQQSYMQAVNGEDDSTDMMAAVQRGMKAQQQKKKVSVEGSSSSIPPVSPLSSSGAVVADDQKSSGTSATVTIPDVSTEAVVEAVDVTIPDASTEAVVEAVEMPIPQCTHPHPWPEYPSCEDLAAHVPLSLLSDALTSKGCKAGGTVLERASRWLAVCDMPEANIPKKFKVGKTRVKINSE